MCYVLILDLQIILLYTTQLFVPLPPPFDDNQSNSFFSDFYRPPQLHGLSLCSIYYHDIHVLVFSCSSHTILQSLYNLRYCSMKLICPIGSLLFKMLP